MKFWWFPITMITFPWILTIQTICRIFSLCLQCRMEDGQIDPFPSIDYIVQHAWTKTSIHSFSCPRPMLHKLQCIVWPSLPHIQPRGLLGETPQQLQGEFIVSPHCSLSRFMIAQLQKSSEVEETKRWQVIYVVQPLFFHVLSTVFLENQMTLWDTDTMWCCHTLHHPHGLGNVPSCWRMGWECPPETATTSSRDLVKFNWVMKIMIPSWFMIQSSFPLLAG